MALAAPPPPHLFPEMKALKDLVDLDVAQAKRNTASSCVKKLLWRTETLQRTRLSGVIFHGIPD
uniref:Uncharacterized protein n=1 Tax=Oryza meridionalis TaxID=40149 RepID=A0A0E0F2N5_9ORYZ